MEFWLTRGENARIKLPINPETIGVSDSNNYEDINLANGDEKTIIGGRDLKTYTLSSYFPRQYSYNPAYHNYASPSPWDYIKIIDTWLLERRFIRFQVTDTNINTQVTIRSFDWHERGGAVGDIEFTIELKEYQPVAYTKIKATAPGTKPQPEKRPPPEKPQPKTYTVVKGDNLWNISKKYLGSGSKWPQIYNKNKGVIGKNPNLIYPGQKLVLP